ncbi:DUF4446 family protein [Bacillaceae bacterium]
MIQEKATQYDMRAVLHNGKDGSVMKVDMTLLPGLVLVFFFLALLSFIIACTSMMKVSKLRKQLRTLLKHQGIDDFAKWWQEWGNWLQELQESVSEQDARLRRLANEVAKRKGRLGVVRFNAFHDTGSDLSFSVALVDDELNGVVITSIYGRDESRVYAKPLEKGRSSYHLSEEEKEALQKALQA